MLLLLLLLLLLRLLYGSCRAKFQREWLHALLLLGRHLRLGPCRAAVLELTDDEVAHTRAAAAAADHILQAVTETRPPHVSIL